MTNPVWNGLTIDPSLLDAYGYNEPVVYNGQTFERFIAYMAAGIDQAVLSAQAASQTATGLDTRVAKAGDTMTGALTMSNATIFLDGPAGGNRVLHWTTAGSRRFAAYIDSAAEGGGNTGSNWNLVRFADDGATLIDSPISVNRQTGLVIVNSLSITLSASIKGLTSAGAIKIDGALNNDRSLQFLTAGRVGFNLFPTDDTGKGADRLRWRAMTTPAPMPAT